MNHDILLVDVVNKSNLLDCDNEYQLEYCIGFNLLHSHDSFTNF